jgi:hypothetical protein
MNKLKVLMILLAVFFVSACGTPQRQHAAILGSTVGWYTDVTGYKVLSNIEVNSLKVRHVSLTSTLCKSGRKEHIEISGPIGPDSSEVVERVLQKLDKCVRTDVAGYFSPTVFINSSGGLLKDGYKLGQIFKSFEVQIVINKNQVCASSCAIAFLGGKFRTMIDDGKLIFHAPYIPNGSSIQCASKLESQEMKGFFNNFLGSKDGDFLFDRTMSFCSRSDGWTINADAAKLFGITN